MYLFDASSLIHAWDNYPLETFPPLWDWMAERIHGREFRLSRIVLNEIKKKAPECAEWIRRVDGELLPETDQILQTALFIKDMLGIKDDAYHPKGVGENDILIIATAKEHGLVLVSDEGKQLKAPKELKKSKIPAVCNLKVVGITCISFIELIKKSGVRFS